MKRWPTAALGEIAGGGQYGLNAPAMSEGTGVRFVRITDITQAGELRHEEPAFVPEDTPELDDYELKDGDVLIARSGATAGKSYIHHSFGERAVFAGYLIRFQPDTSKILPRFIGAFLQTPAYWQQLNSHKRAVAQPNVNAKQLASLVLPMPPLVEQERIVKLLDEADELRKLRTRADRRTAALIPALFHDMFVRADFVEKTIGQFLEQGWLLLHKDGNHGSLYPRSSDFGIEGIPFLSATCVTNEGTIDHSEVKRLAEEKAKLLRHGWIECGDVLLAHNASVGAVGFYGGDYDRAIIGTSLTAFRANVDRIEPRFLWASLRDIFFQDQLERIMKQALRNQVPITAQRELFLRIPALALQKEFASRVAKIRAMEVQQLISRQKLDALFQSLLHRAFRGEL